jgi:glycosyltransferase involved in cell wall biosynthesis
MSRFETRSADERAPVRTAKHRILLIVHAELDAAVVGGTEQHVGHLITQLGDRHDFFVLYHARRNHLVLEQVLAVRDGRFEKRSFELSLEAHSTADWLAVLARAFRLDLIHVHHVLHHEIGPLFEGLRAFAGAKLYSLHDHHPVCANLNLLYKNTRHCGLPSDPAVCAACIGETHGWSFERLQAYRAVFKAHLPAFDRVIFPSESLRRTVAAPLGLPPEKTLLMAHGSAATQPSTPGAPYEGGTLRVAFIGALLPHKGTATLARLIAQNRCDDVEWHIWGFPLQPFPTPRHGRVIDHGPYAQSDIVRLLSEARIHVGLLPAICAETFSFTLSEFFAAGLPVIGSSLGAIGDRLRAQRAGWVVDPEDPDGFLAVIDQLHADPAGWRRLRDGADFSVRPLAEMAQAYDALYQSFDRLPEAAGAEDAADAELLEQAASRAIARQRRRDPLQAIAAPFSVAATAMPAERPRFGGRGLAVRLERVARLAVFYLARYAPRTLKDAVKAALRKGWL